MTWLRMLWVAILSWLRRAPAAPQLPPAIAVRVPEPAPAPPDPPAEAGPHRAPAVPSPMPDPAPPALDLDAHRTLIVPDVYPPDVGNKVPPFAAIIGKAIAGKEIAGCYLKQSEGLGWGAANERWYVDSVAAFRKIAGDAYGVTAFVGGYDFLRFQLDGARQAEYAHSVRARAGGLDRGSLAIMVDVEEGGQGSWAPGRLETLDAATKRRLAGEVRGCLTAYIARTRELCPGARILVYGRGLFRDLEMTDVLCGANGVVNPAYTQVMPAMTRYGVPLDKIAMWQLCGDGTVVAPGYPSLLPGWGRTDYSVHLAGAGHTSWRTFYASCLALPR